MNQPTAVPAIVDTHMHLDEPAFDEDRDGVLAAARREGVRHFINIGHKPERWESSRSLREKHPDVAIAIGVHPQEATSFDSALATRLRDAVEELRPVAIGETGFDFARSSPLPNEQKRAFRAQLEIASASDLPVVIHQREASDALMSELDRWPDLAPIVLHSFDGNNRLTDWAVERRCYVGIGGLATKRASADLRELLKRVPTERLLLETDSPYLPPPGLPSRRNSPANLPLLAAILAPLWGLTAEDLCRQTTMNAETVFGFGHGGHAPGFVGC